MELMKLNERFTGNLGHCVVYPQTSGAPDGGVIWTGNRVMGDWGPDIEIAMSSLEELAKRFLGFSRVDIAEMKVENEKLRQRVADLERECSRYEDAFTAIDVLESADFRARRKAGRKPAKPAA